MFAFIIFCISSSRFSLKSSIFIYCSLFRSHTSTKFGILVISMQWRQYSHKLCVKINFPSNLYTNKNLPSFYGQKMFQRKYLRRCWLTHKESCMGHRKKPISDISQILIFLEIFRKGSQPPSFWTEITSTHCY